VHPILIIAILVLTLLGVWIFQTRQQRLSKDNFKWIAIVAVIVLALLAASGRVHWLGAIIAGLLASARSALPMLIRFFPFLHQQFQQSKQKQRFHEAGASGVDDNENISTVSTGILEMNLNHQTSEMNGRVIAGTFSGMQLNNLDLQQCTELREYCHQSDEQSAELLDAYLERRFGDNWQQQTKQGYEHHSSQSPTNSGNMGKEEAYEVLGIPSEASKEEIISAHRKLMQKCHPDRGGSTYLATKLNQAKDCLLG